MPEHIGGPVICQSLQNAIAKTFERRGTEIPSSRPVSLNTDFAIKYNRKWQQFLNRLSLENSEIDDLLLIVDKIWEFLEYPLHELASGNNKKNHRHWMPSEKKWK